MIRWLLNRLAIDRAVFYALLLRSWQLLAGFVSLLLIAQFLSPEVQGFYYTFASLMAAQAFFELGFNIVVINFCSHEWAHLRIDDQGSIAGDAQALSRLVSLGRLLFKWYAIASFLFAVSIGIGGAIFLSRHEVAAISWQQPWVALVVLSALFLWTLPFVAMLEGCHQVAIVNRFRVIQAVAANIAVWSAIALGGGLWAVVAAAAVKLLWDLYLLCIRYRSFFRPFWRSPTGERIDWQADLWPMQWRLAILGVVGFFEFELFTLVMFRIPFDGIILAGQMGMTWTALKALQAASTAWVQTKAPLFGSLISQRKFDELDRLFFRLSLISLGVITAGGTVLCLLVFGLNAMEFSLADRLLAPTPTVIFTLAVVLKQFPNCQMFYLRAHRREPLLLLNIISSSLIGLLVWLLGSQYGPTGAGLGLLSVIVFLTLPFQTFLWARYRKEWHEDAIE